MVAAMVAPTANDTLPIPRLNTAVAHVLAVKNARLCR
jgi:hypothetical protein